MISELFRISSKYISRLIWIFSIFVLFRGHNFPGGGFIAGLVAACGTGILLLGCEDMALCRRYSKIAIYILPVGFVLILLTGSLSFLNKHQFLSSYWTTFASFKLGTPLIFDIAVFLVVSASATIMLTSLERSIYE